MHLDLEAVSVEIAGATLLRALDLSVGSGEILGLVGPNGSGKSTALRCIYRALRPTTGVVRLDGTDVGTQPLRTTARSVAALTQENHTELDFTVAEVVALGRFPHLRGNQQLSDRERDLCRAAMARTEVSHLADRGMLSLSGGERQRVLIARALVQEPQLLVLDEPTNHLDVHHQVQLLSFLRECGLTVVVALHDLNLAASTCDRLAVLRQGGLVATGTPADVLEPGLIRQVFGVAPSIVAHPRTGVPQLLFDLDATRHHQNDPEGMSL
ncbi:iron complex transport system ATP-binding protein [Amycolatopsis marina]|uniref:Iron complex transport system ATP-binding protein n=1 Tax=Amycolatopsis marina TaxID=490629 RepID=A0A1I1C8I5_9PSEU|nr:ABC transporter ATP-binding protein [Amycolatopsis marina]SFB58949.1 iron complex transport system ATP-binding protein [Amycolatopsis marina]